MALIAWLAEEDAMMALGRNMQALAARDCFQQSPDGVAWRAANDMLHLPGQRMSTHMDDVYCLSDMCRTYENCPESPVSLKVEVLQWTSAEDEPDPPVVRCAVSQHRKPRSVARRSRGSMACDCSRIC